MLVDERDLAGNADQMLELNKVLKKAKTRADVTPQMMARNEREEKPMADGSFTKPREK